MPANRTAGVDDGGPEPDGALTGALDAISGLCAELAAVVARRGSQVQHPSTMDSLATVIDCAAGIVNGLAAELAEIQNALEQAAHTASRYGVKIGIDGQPPPVLPGPQADAAAMSEQHWALAYQKVFEQAKAEDGQARARAARQLMDLAATIGGQVPHWASGAGGADEGASRNGASSTGLIAPSRAPWPRPTRE
jgi:hypothetical protein